MIFWFFFGAIMGAGVVGSSVYRTLAVEHGNLSGTFWGSILNSLTYFFSVLMIANNNYVAYTGTAVGSTICVLVMAYKNRKAAQSAKDV